MIANVGMPVLKTNFRQHLRWRIQREFRLR